MILNFLLFKEPKVEDIFDFEMNKPVKERIPSNKGIEEKENIIEKSIERK